jgi:hypothetical protein
MRDDVQTPPAAPRLLDQIRERLRVKHYGYRTETQYIQWIRRFILFHDKRHPKRYGRGRDRAFFDGQWLQRSDDSGAAAACGCRHEPVDTYVLNKSKKAVVSPLDLTYQINWALSQSSTDTGRAIQQLNAKRTNNDAP